MTTEAPETPGSGDNGIDLVAELRKFALSKLPQWEKEARDEILETERAEEWKKEMKRLREVLESANNVTSDSAFVTSFMEFGTSACERLDRTEEAILDYIDFTKSGKPPDSDVHEKAAFIRERRIFQREILDRLRLLGANLLEFRFPPN